MTDTAASVQPERHSWLVSIARGIRDGILIVGVSVLLVVAVEACVRLWGAASESLSRRGAEGPPSPSAGKPWVAEFNREFDATRAVGWQSYVYFRRLPSYHGVSNANTRQPARIGVTPRSLPLLLAPARLVAVFPAV